MQSRLQTVGRSGRKQSRKTFLPQQRPSIYFGHIHAIVRGYLVDYSAGGIGIEVNTEAWTYEPGQQIIERLFIDTIEDHSVLSDLEIRYVVSGHTKQSLRIGLSYRNNDSAAKLQVILHRVYGMPDPDPRVFEAVGMQMRRIHHDRSLHQYCKQAIDQRQQWLKLFTGKELQHAPKYTFDASTLAGNIENFTGCVQIPVGIVGPIKVNGTYADGYVPVPIATTEGALVSSISRGAAICNIAGGIQTQVLRQVMRRAPIFYFRDMTGAYSFAGWVQANYATIKTIAESSSRIAKLQSIEPFIFGSTVHLSFNYQTGDASGQNMTTACTYLACDFIAKQIAGDPSLGFERYLLEGNMSGDKKANQSNFTHGRGIAVQAQAHIPDALLRRFLRTSAKDLARAWQEVCVSSCQVGMQGTNVNVANVIAGIFTATGQDIASVHESSLGILQVREEGNGILITAYLPSLVIGTVGGGTGLESQREWLDIMGCAGPRRVFKFAEVIAAACLSLELSTGGALLAHEFVHAHEALGRNRTSKALKRADLDLTFIQNLVGKRLAVKEMWPQDMVENHGLTTKVSGQDGRSDVYGLHRYQLQLKHPFRDRTDMSVVLKVKSPSEDLIALGVDIAKLTGADDLPGMLEANAGLFGFSHNDLRENLIYTHLAEPLRAYLPEIYGWHRDEQRGYSAILMEDLSASLGHPKIDDWSGDQIELALRAAADLHAHYFDNYQEIASHLPAAELDWVDIERAQSLLKQLASYNKKRFTEFFEESFCDSIKSYLFDCDRWHQALMAFPKTLCHGDFNPRNMAIKGQGTGDQHLVVFDWELARIMNPSWDLIDLLSLAVPEESSEAEIYAHIESYFDLLQAALEQTLDKQAFLRNMHANLCLWTLIRGNLYLLVHNVLPVVFIKHQFANLIKLERVIGHALHS